MKRIERKVAFITDLNDVWNHLDIRNEAAANRFLERVNERVLPLARHPLMGRARPDIHPECRQLVV